jgi:hypothetical protein
VAAPAPSHGSERTVANQSSECVATRAQPRWPCEVRPKFPRSPPGVAPNHARGTLLTPKKSVKSCKVVRKKECLFVKLQHSVRTEPHTQLLPLLWGPLSKRGHKFRSPKEPLMLRGYAHALPHPTSMTHLCNCKPKSWRSSFVAISQHYLPTHNERDNEELITHVA